MDDLTKPIARAGEPIYASIHRERSGIDSGTISLGVRVAAVNELRDGDQRDIVRAALVLLDIVLNETKPINHAGRHILARCVAKFGIACEDYMGRGNEASSYNAG